MNLLQQMQAKVDNDNLGYVYIMEFRFKSRDSYKVLYKVGVTKNAPIDRMLTIARDFFMSRRYVPECRLVRMRKVANYYKIENKLHTILKEYNYSFNRVFDGSGEFFCMDLDTIDKIYCDNVPKLSDYKREDKLPKWAYSDKEVVEIDKIAIEQDNDYYVIEQK